MGMNYYLIIKKPYNKEDKLNEYQDYYDEVREIENGFLYKNFYYASIEKLNDKFNYKLHIGKSSYGWHFSLCIYPELNINNLDDWKELFKDNAIIDEEYKPIEIDEMLDKITNRYRKDWDGKNSQEYEDKLIEGINTLTKEIGGRTYDDYDDFLKDNMASRGFNGLLKHKSNEYVKWINTDGTYDLTPDWDFS